MVGPRLQCPWRVGRVRLGSHHNNNTKQLAQFGRLSSSPAEGPFLSWSSRCCHSPLSVGGVPRLTRNSDDSVCSGVWGLGLGFRFCVCPSCGRHGMLMGQSVSLTGELTPPRVIKGRERDRQVERENESCARFPPGVRSIPFGNELAGSPWTEQFVVRERTFSPLRHNQVLTGPPRRSAGRR